MTAPAPQCQPTKNELRSFAQSTRDGRCLEVWYARNVTDEDRADLLAAVNSHVSLKARIEELEGALRGAKETIGASQCFIQCQCWRCRVFKTIDAALEAKHG